MNYDNYIAQPTKDEYDAYAVWHRERGEYILCGRPSEILKRPGVVIFGTVSERISQLQGTK